MGSVAPPKAEALMTKFKLRDLDLPNRMVLAPMTRGRGTAAHVPTPMMADYYTARAAGGLLITEGTFISPAAIGWANAPEIYSDAAVAAWKDVTAAVHAAGGRIFCQLWHTGRASHSAFRGDGSLGVAPSAAATPAVPRGATPAPGADRPTGAPRPRASRRAPPRGKDRTARRPPLRRRRRGRRCGCGSGGDRHPHHWHRRQRVRAARAEAPMVRPAT